MASSADVLAAQREQPAPATKRAPVHAFQCALDVGGDALPNQPRDGSLKKTSTRRFSARL
jgi:hypothetical protein